MHRDVPLTSAPIFTMWLTIFLLSFVVWFFFFRRQRPDVKGPRGLPYIGNALQMDAEAPHKTLSAWADQYGGMYRITVFGKDILVVNSEKAVRQVLVDTKDFNERPTFFRINYLYDDGIMFEPYNQRWSMLKKHTMTSLKLVGDGVKRLEDIGRNMIEILLKKMEDNNKEAFNPIPLLHQTVCNINATLIFGWELSETEQREIQRYDYKILEILGMGSGLLLEIFPWLRFFPNKDFEGLKELKQIHKQVIGSAAEKSLKFRDNGEEFDSALQDIIKLTDASEWKVTKHTITSIAADLMGAGNTTTSTFLTGLIAQLANDQELQKRCQSEVDRVLDERQPVFSDRGSLPFIESLILEQLRLTSHVPTVYRKVTTDTVLAGKHVTKGTEIWVNLWHLHHDPTLWDDPWVFKPDRFLDEHQNLLPPDHTLRKRLLPFGAGRRICIGEAMTRNRLFLFTCFLLQRFTFLPGEEGGTLPADPRTWRVGMVLMPPEYEVRAIPR